MIRDTSIIKLSYIPPFSWQETLEFWKLRKINGVEHITDKDYIRTVQFNKDYRWIRISNCDKENCFEIEYSNNLNKHEFTLIKHLIKFLDLNTDINVVEYHLMKDEFLSPLIKNRPGLRIPGMFCVFEMCLRGIFEQQITVKAARTLFNRFIENFGQKILTPFPELNYLSPTPGNISKLTIKDIRKLGLPRNRAEAVINLAKEFEENNLNLYELEPEFAIRQLISFKGIGPWTANYIAMRSLNYMDAFPPKDIAIHRFLNLGIKESIKEITDKWKPYRSYAVIHIWQNS